MFWIFSLPLSLSQRYFRNQVRSRNLTRQAQYDIVLGKATALYGHVITAWDCRWTRRREWQGTVSRTVREARGGTEEREKERERERSSGWDEEKETDDDDGYKGGCPSSFSSAAAANPSGDSARQLSTDCWSLPLEKPRPSKLNAERLVRALLRWTVRLWYRFQVDKKNKGKNEW